MSEHGGPTLQGDGSKPRPFHVSIANWQHSKHLMDVIVTVTNVLTSLSSIGALVGLILVYMTLEATRESTDSANRAWLEVENVDFDPVYIAGEGRTSLDVTNVGGEPAQNVQMSLHVGVDSVPNTSDSAPFPVITADICHGRGVHPRGIVFKDRPLNLNLSWPDNSVFQGGNLRPAFVQELHTGTAVLYYQGCLVYTTRGIQHITNFCDYVSYDTLRKQVSRRICPYGNSAN
jgi:hypothetical protein